LYTRLLSGGQGWTFLDPHTHVWPPLKPTHSYEGACPTIRYVKADDYYYVLNLHTGAKDAFEFV
jgi:hypothetical protein